MGNASINPMIKPNTKNMIMADVINAVCIISTLHFLDNNCLLLNPCIKNIIIKTTGIIMYFVVLDIGNIILAV